jgi:histidinol-phosphate aminotransferase
VSRFLNRNTRKLIPYTPGEQPMDSIFIKLNTNENPYPPSPLVMGRIKDFRLEDLRLYPNSEGASVKQAAAKYYGISADEVFAGNGSDEVLAFIFKAFFDSTEKIGFPDITYSFYPVYSDLFEIPYVKVPVADDFSIDFSKYPEDLKGIIFANPNAPTGIYIPPERIEELLTERPNTLIIVDEAYIDFGGESCIPLISRYDNLIVVQTLSKSRALAGQRVGLAIGQRELMEGLTKIKDSFNSYPLDRIAQIAAEAAFDDTGYFNETRRKIIKTREWTQEQLLGSGVEATDSKANFLFIKIPGIKGPEALLKLRQEGILVRNFSQMRICDWLRITIGTQEDMEILVKKIKKIMAD